jgi:hypothetical protein
MLSKLRIATILTLIVTLGTVSVAFAQEDTPEGTFRVAGEITQVVPGQGTFTILTRHGTELTFATSDMTKFKSPDGSIEDIHDLKKGMKALVIGKETDEDHPLALLVAAGLPEDLPERIRVLGHITSVNPDRNTFSIVTRDETAMTFAVGERTHYRGEGIDGLEDLQPEMGVLVVGVEREEGGLFALIVAAGNPDERPDRIRVAGQVTNVIPGQGTFTLKPRNGDEITFQTNERTQFKSRDGSITELRDLKRGMIAAIIAVKQEDDLPLALLVAAGHPEDRPDRPRIDVRAAGQIVALGNASLTIQNRDGAQMTFGINENTKFKSRDGSINGLDDLEVGMVAAIGAIENEDGSLTAAWVAAGQPRQDRPGPDHAPNRKPDARPQDASPDQGVEL